jgi:hypothetical protein
LQPGYTLDLVHFQNEFGLGLTLSSGSLLVVAYLDILLGLLIGSGFFLFGRSPLEFLIAFDSVI